MTTAELFAFGDPGLPAGCWPTHPIWTDKLVDQRIVDANARRACQEYLTRSLFQRTILDMAAARLSPSSQEALQLLGWSIRAARVRRRWSSAELAERVGVSRPTISKIEHGDPGVAIGTFFEAATLVGVPLFDDDATRRRFAAHKRTELALLPESARRLRRTIDDNF